MCELLHLVANQRYRQNVPISLLRNKSSTMDATFQDVVLNSVLDMLDIEPRQRCIFETSELQLTEALAVSARGLVRSNGRRCKIGLG